MKRESALSIKKTLMWAISLQAKKLSTSAKTKFYLNLSHVTKYFHLF